ncbi:EH signature domain-containing protein [Microvirga yunnanensis]|uniref:EH signature domain-containing protein n=1 Tax=Microvirga yunnanensis TaxID=2953740 RepID=UPI0021C91F2C|nr:EH signature domain-containing protein [Microvirga sp. HBU65207]
MHTREALVTLRAATQALSRVANLPERLASAKAVAELGAAEAAPALPATAVLEQVRARILEAARSQSGIRALDRRDLRDAAWLLWDAKMPMMRIAGLLDALFALARTRASARRNLIEAWLRDFSPQADGLAAAGQAIRLLLKESPDARLELWRQADRRFDLFDPHQGPRKLATWLVQGLEPVEHILDVTGFADPLRAVGGYMRAVQGEVLGLAAAALKGPVGPDALARLETYLAPDGALRFREPAGRGQVAQGLLAAWLTSGQEPSEDVRRSVQGFLLHHLGDPRIRPDAWREAGPEVTAVMRRWLTRASLKAFFTLISDHALDQHWRYREAFWLAYLEKGLIKDAWLGLGSKVHASARAVRELNGAYGRLSGASSDQSILLLQLGDVVFCEWSHSGALRAWSTGWKNAPLLGQAGYTRDMVTGLGLPFPPNPERGRGGAPDGKGLSHIGSDTGYWQGSAAELIARRTGVRLTKREWMPR